jgi:hypothetical protein
MLQAIEAADSVKETVPIKFKADFDKGIEELNEFRIRVLAYVYHLKETNLANDIRTSIKLRLPQKERLKNLAELRGILIKDQENEKTKEPIALAIKLLDKDLNKFLKTYFLPSKGTNLRGDWSITSN